MSDTNTSKGMGCLGMIIVCLIMLQTCENTDNITKLEKEIETLKTEISKK